MKHNLQVISILIFLFFITQIIGLTVIDRYSEEALPYDIERPEFEPSVSYLPIIIVILIATALAFLLAKFKLFKLWKLWFFLSLFFCLLIAFGAFFDTTIATFLALLFSLLKFFYRNAYTHNFPELFVYGGLAALFVDTFSVISIVLLMILISIYDAIAVWKTKHMVKLAKAQSKMKIFAGLMVPYKKKVAILGGGDLGFTLLFAGVVFKAFGWIPALVTIVFATSALTLLFYHGNDKKFYPAMPFLSAGCFIGLLFSLLCCF